MLTLQNLKDMKPGVFASGELPWLKWVAVRGDIHDWAIYTGEPHMSFERIKDFGHKSRNYSLIKGFVPCDQEAFDMYRLM